MTPSPDLRQLNGSDGDLLRTATLTNVNWAGGRRFTYGDIDRAPQIRHYYDFRPDRGDVGFVAEHDRLTVGVVWLLYLDSVDPGYGFVGDGVPELSLTVWSGYRGQGIGRSLLTAALGEAQARGLPRVSLSVEAGNPALFLYRSLGFEPADGAPEGTYVVNLERS